MFKQDEKIVILEFKSAWETEWWLEGLRRAIETDRESAKTIHGALKYNVASLYQSFNNNKTNKELDKFCKAFYSGLSLDLTADNFAQRLKELTEELNYLTDAFYARKPFVRPFFEDIVVMIHTGVREAIEAYWNQFYKVLIASEVAQIASAINAYEKNLLNWGIVDKNCVWIESVSTTLATKLFAASKTPIENIFRDLPQKTFSNNGKIFPEACQTLETHLFFLLSHFQTIQVNMFAEKLIEVVYNLLMNFFISAQALVRWHSFDHEISIALLNNTFLKTLKAITKKVHTDTKSQLSLVYIRQKLKENSLLLLLNDIENAILKKIIKNWRKEVSATSKSDKSFLDFDFQKTIGLVINRYSIFIKQCVLREHMDLLYYQVFDKILSNYYATFIDFFQGKKLNSIRFVMEKLDKDLKILSWQLENYRFESSQKILLKMQQLRRFLLAENIDTTIATILTMQVFYKKLLQGEHIKRLLNAKIYFSQRSIDFMINYLKVSYQEETKQRKTRFTVTRIAFNTNIYNFIFKLSRLNRNGS